MVMGEATIIRGRGDRGAWAAIVRAECEVVRASGRNLERSPFIHPPGATPVKGAFLYPGARTGLRSTPTPSSSTSTTSPGFIFRV